LGVTYAILTRALPRAETGGDTSTHGRVAASANPFVENVLPARATSAARASANLKRSLGREFDRRSGHRECFLNTFFLSIEHLHLRSMRCFIVYEPRLFVVPFDFS